ncbi:MAG: hypothetical protein QGG15_01575 [Dehalococcoidales bacterium]|jgi:hypothetical protein|nr:hypothetical protein [Dehalococcoidales bacterium]MDP6737704.1 hypothetical protein [Dehalococcoidales bacterium]|tara:strand:- start:322 stop:774 length:453 start_codon:yes stop_codon:yes gene_type:complete
MKKRQLLSLGLCLALIGLLIGCASSVDSDYREWSGKTSDLLSRDLQNFNNVFGIAMEREIESQARATAIHYAEQLRDHAESALTEDNYDVSSKWEESQQNYRKALSDYRDAGQYMSSGLAISDKNKIERGMAYISSGATNMKAAIETMPE